MLVYRVDEEQNGKDRADYGKHLIKNLSLALNDEFGKGFSVVNLKNFRQFYLTFQDWDATPEDQKVKFITLSRHIKAHPDYHDKVADNQDLQTRDLAFKKILEDVMSQQRRQELELYKLYAKDDAFKHAFINTMLRMTERVEETV